MQEATIDYLSAIEVLRDLSPEELTRLDRQMTTAIFSAGKVLHTPEEIGEVLFLLKKGQVRLYRQLLDGRKLVMATLGPGAMFGEMTLAGLNMHQVYAEAVGDCTLCVMSRSDVERLVKEKPQVASRIAEAWGDRRLEFAERESG